MRIAGFRHKDLERFWRRDEARGVARQHEAKLRAMLTARFLAGDFILSRVIEKVCGA
jgi:plasmid maintenance system killer protein